MAVKPMEQTDRVQFIQNLELATVALSDLPPSNKPQGFVNAGCLTSFTEKLSGQDKADILNSTLLAQLAANKQLNRQEQPQEWYAFYQNVLSKVGWVIQGFSFDDYKPSSNTFTMDNVVLDQLKASTSSDEMEVLEATIKALQQLQPTDGLAVLFNSQCFKDHAGNFQVQLCTKNQNGQIVIALGTFYFNTSENVTSPFFFWTYHLQQTGVHYAVQTTTLDEQVYAQVRDEIVSKLGTQYQTYVHELYN